jgi:hypothetical protein
VILSGELDKAETYSSITLVNAIAAKQNNDLGYNQWWKGGPKVMKMG